MMTSYLESFSKWIQLKIYQLEITYSVYIFTPIEKFIFYSVLFLIFSLTFIATVLYLPHHLQFIISRAWFYINGDAPSAAVAVAASSTLGKLAQATGEVVREL